VIKEELQELVRFVYALYNQALYKADEKQIFLAWWALLQDLEAELEDAIADDNGLDEFECRSILAQAYLDAAQPRRAVVHCEALVELLTRAEGPESERQMIWRGFLGRALTEARRYFEATDVLSDLLVDRERIFRSAAGGFFRWSY
jgi:hypothetical protein